MPYPSYYPSLNLVLVTPPAVELLTVDEVKKYLRLQAGETSEDAYLTSLIVAAREYCENFQNRAYITQTWELSFYYWPSWEIEIPRGNLQKIDLITYKDSWGQTYTLTEGFHYVVTTRGVLGRISPPYAKFWPPFTPWPLDAVVIRFTCGYGDATSAVPVKVLQAMKMLISHWYENREATGSASKEVEFAVSALLWPDRVVPF